MSWEMEGEIFYENLKRDLKPYGIEPAVQQVRTLFHMNSSRQEAKQFFINEDEKARKAQRVETIKEKYQSLPGDTSGYFAGESPTFRDALKAVYGNKHAREYSSVMALQLDMVEGIATIDVDLDASVSVRSENITLHVKASNPLTGVIVFDSEGHTYKVSTQNIVNGLALYGYLTVCSKCNNGDFPLREKEDRWANTIINVATIPSV